MNKIIFIIACLCFSSIIAQKPCGTIDKPFEKWISEIGRPELNKNYLEPRAKQYIPIHYHIIRRDDGSDGYPTNYLYFIHCDLNYEFEKNGMDIEFYMDTVSYINSDKYFDITKPEDDVVTAQYNTLKHCNVYLVNDPNGACGYVTDFPSQGSPENRSSIFIQASRLKFDCSNPGNKTLPHEMGHWLDLRHTFSGWEGQTYPPNLSQHPRSEWEDVDRNGNCLEKGDGFCDTDPDYVPKRWTCPYSATPLSDGNGVSFIPSGRNFMSYSNDECSDSFSPQQRMRMLGALDNFNDRKDLKNIPVPDYPVIGSFSYFFPKEPTDQNHRFSRKNFTIRFNSLEGADYYLVTLGKSNSSTIQNSYDFLPADLLLDTLLTTDTFFRVPDILLGGGINNNYFYWKVRAINKMSACGDNVIAKQAFRLKSLNLEFKGEDPSCHGYADGKLFILDSSGSGTNNYFVNGGTTTSPVTVENVGAGLHKLEVKQIDGTSVLFDYFLKEPEKVTGEVSYLGNFSARVEGKGGDGTFTYEWSSGQTGKEQSNLAAGDYTVTITDSKGCKSDEINLKINSNGSGGSSIANSTLSHISLIPTRIRSGETLQLINLENPVQLEIFDLSGKVVKTISLTKIENSFQCDIKSTGLYIVKIRSDKGERTQKIEIVN